MGQTLKRIAYYSKNVKETISFETYEHTHDPSDTLPAAENVINWSPAVGVHY